MAKAATNPDSGSAGLAVAWIWFRAARSSRSERRGSSIAEGARRMAWSSCRAVKRRRGEKRLLTAVSKAGRRRPGAAATLSGVSGKRPAVAFISRFPHYPAG